ncbi:ABC transporter permease [Phycicoccus sp. BSK3Z-2]|uniref:Transport permease protein n=1 Tax=Phycicoccus avicenniae TaxID=2828860 RepID=A0A941HZN3_9MICO|nr:ABC transporter permease [Phycicoccus avicenniae]MBR7744278.1 ABC transporter permease [Phycicoccus avicenniae]
MSSGPTTALLRTEARLFVREPGAWFWILVFPTALLCVLGLVPSFREPSPDLGGARVLDLYVPVCVLFAVLVAGVQTMPTVLATYRERGIVRRLRTTPLSPASLLLAQAVVHAALVVVSVVLVLTVGWLGYGSPLPAQPLGYLLALLLAVAAMTGVGALVTAFSRTTKIAAAVGSVVLFPMMFTSGVWLPVAAMPEGLQRVVLLSPLGAAARALTDATAGDVPALVDLAVMAGWALVLGAAAVRWFRWE